MQSLEFGSTAELARRTGVSCITAWRLYAVPGLRRAEGGTFRIPEAHVQRAERGEFPAAIAADARAAPSTYGSNRLETNSKALVQAPDKNAHTADAQRH
jgi:hypothetical protein